MAYGSKAVDRVPPWPRARRLSALGLAWAAWLTIMPGAAYAGESDAAVAAPVAPPAVPTGPFAGEIANFIAADRGASPARCPLLFVGSSSIRIWEVLAPDFVSEAVVFRGFGGARIRDVNDNFSSVVGPHRPRAIIFYAGENDIAAGEAPETVVAGFRTFLELKSHLLGTTPVYFLSLKPSPSRLAQLAKQSAVNEQVAAIARDRDDLVLIDVVQPMMAEGHPRGDLFVSDGLHMNSRGYDLWRSAVEMAIEKEPVSDAPGC